MALLVTGFVLFFFVFWTIMVYNKLVQLKNMKTEAWNGIDVQIKRRDELFPIRSGPWKVTLATRRIYLNASAGFAP